MIGEEILSIIAERYGANAANTAYYSKIDEWESWWKGYNRSFHEFTENGAGGRLIRRELYRMNMAKGALRNAPLPFRNAPLCKGSWHFAPKAQND